MWAAFAKRLAVTALLLAGAGTAGAVLLPERAPSPRAGTVFLPPSALQAAAPAGLAGAADPPEVVRNFYFTRAMYSGSEGWNGWKSWSTDYPKADRQLLVVLRRLTNLDAYEREHPVRLDDPELRRFPFLYAVEAGHMQLTESQVKGLRDYLLAGGFLFCDDFWGSYEWRNFEYQMRRVLPEYRIVDLPLDHPIFHTYYDVGEIVQVPNVGQGISGGPTYEQDGYTPHIRGILDDKGRLLVVIDWNSDMGDAWEWAEHPQYPLKFSTYAFQMTTNIIVYAMSH